MVSLYVGLDGRQQRESDITDLDEFYERLRASQESVTTSQPSVGDFVATYEPLLDQGREIVSTPSPRRSRAPTKRASGSRAPQRRGQGRRADRASRLPHRRRRDGDDRPRRGRGACGGRLGGGGGRAGRRGAPFPEDLLRGGHARYFWRGGRIGAARALIGSTLKIKPILTMDEEITPIERVRTRARSIERLVDHAGRLHEDGAGAWVIQHVQDPDTAASLEERCRADLWARPPVRHRDRTGDRRPRRPRAAGRRRASLRVARGRLSG